MAEGREKLQVKEFLIVGVWEWKSYSRHTICEPEFSDIKTKVQCYSKWDGEAGKRYIKLLLFSTLVIVIHLCFAGKGQLQFLTPAA